MRVVASYPVFLDDTTSGILVFAVSGNFCSLNRDGGHIFVTASAPMHVGAYIGDLEIGSPDVLGTDL